MWNPACACVCVCIWANISVCLRFSDGLKVSEYVMWISSWRMWESGVLRVPTGPDCLIAEDSTFHGFVMELQVYSGPHIFTGFSWIRSVCFEVQKSPQKSKYKKIEWTVVPCHNGVHPLQSKCFFLKGALGSASWLGVDQCQSITFVPCIRYRVCSPYQFYRNLQWGADVFVLFYNKGLIYL